MSERVGERLSPLPMIGEGFREWLKSLLMKKGLGLMEDLMKEGWMVGGKSGLALRRRVLASLR